MVRNECHLNAKFFSWTIKFLNDVLSIINESVITVVTCTTPGLASAVAVYSDSSLGGRGGTDTCDGSGSPKGDFLHQHAHVLTRSKYEQMRNAISVP